jgi:ribosome-associated protein
MAKRTRHLTDSEQLCENIVKGMSEKKGVDIAVIDLRELKNAIADFFVVCTGTSDPHTEAVADSVEEVVHKSLQQDPYKREGFENKEWILLDYIDVVVHILRADKRNFYSLEKLWGDAPVKFIDQH